jgi:hypothetical protein
MDPIFPIYIFVSMPPQDASPLLIIPHIVWQDLIRRNHNHFAVFNWLQLCHYHRMASWMPQNDKQTIGVLPESVLSYRAYLAGHVDVHLKTCGVGESIRALLDGQQFVCRWYTLIPGIPVKWQLSHLRGEISSCTYRSLGAEYKGTQVQINPSSQSFIFTCDTSTFVWDVQYVKVEDYWLLLI